MKWNGYSGHLLGGIFEYLYKNMSENTVGEKNNTF